MAVMAEWNVKKWEVSTEKITSIQDLSFAYEQKSDSNQSAEGSPPTNARGLEPFSLTFSCVLHANAGVCIESEIESWKSLVTKTAPFFLGGKQLGPVLGLQRISVGSVTLDDYGRMRVATLSFTLKEEGGEVAKTTASTSTSERIEKVTSALNVTPSTAVKSSIKTINTQIKNAKTNIMTNLSNKINEIKSMAIKK